MKPTQLHKGVRSGAVKQEAPPPNIRGLTATAIKIRSEMERAGIRGNFRDFVLFVGDQMYDTWGTYTVRRDNATADVRPIALVHKRDLHKIIGPFADRFWNRRMGKRTSDGSKRA
jgi:hypothetical protein